MARLCGRLSPIKIYAFLVTLILIYYQAEIYIIRSAEKVEILQLNDELRKERQNHNKNLLINKPAYFQVPKIYNYEAEVDKTIFLITPTYPRHTQKADLTRLLYTLLHVPNLHWIIVEDHDSKTQIVVNFLNQIPTTIKWVHLYKITPENDKLKSDDPNWLKPRGVQQRNKALEYLRQEHRYGKGMIYFMDDDNTYDVRVFNEIRKVPYNKVGVWPVGIVGKLRYEGPVCKHGEVISWFTAWKPDRPFPVDMAGYSFHLDHLMTHPNARFEQRVPRGYQESFILTELGFNRSDAAAMADDCKSVIVWHTRTEKPRMDAEEYFIKKRGYGSDMDIEV